jgi:AcrR family transcriptional regulator
MPRDATLTRRKILASSYELFYQKGYYRVSVDDVAGASGVTKRTLYYHFKSKDELLSAVLEFHQGMALERIRKWGDRLSGSPAQAIHALFADLNRWSSKPRWNGSGFTRLAMELADMPGHPARAVAGSHKKTLEAWLAALLKRLGANRAGELARQVQLLMEGATSLTLIHGDRAYVAAAAKAARKLATTASGS